jgi:predicted nicotinamide N-methyase
VTLSAEQAKRAADALLSMVEWRAPALVPEWLMPHVDDELAVWQAMEKAAGVQVGAPFGAVVWPAAQVIVRALLDGIVDVRGRVVVDIGCGSGAVAIAAARTGASHVIAIDIDPIACAVTRVCAERARCSVDVVCGDGFAHRHPGAVYIMADAIHSADGAHAAHVALQSWLVDSDAIVADAGRPFCAQLLARWPATMITSTSVPVPRGVEGVAERRVELWRFERPSDHTTRANH